MIPFFLFRCSLLHNTKYNSLCYTEISFLGLPSYPKSLCHPPGRHSFCQFRASAFASGNMNSFLRWELLLHLLLLCDIILGFIWGFLMFVGFGGHFPCSTQTLTTQQPMLSWRRMRKMDSRAMESPSLWEEALKLVSWASLKALGCLHSTNIPALNWN